jgi:hypothetical protein
MASGSESLRLGEEPGERGEAMNAERRMKDGEALSSVSRLAHLNKRAVQQNGADSKTVVAR